jgi:capsular polysaccharide biosynthesis protein
MNEKQKNLKNEISLLEIYFMIVDNILGIVIITSLIFLSSLSYSLFLVEPDYRSNADVMVQVEQTSSQTNTNYDFVNAFRLIDTIAELMKKDIILINARDKLVDLGYSGIDLKYLRDGLNIKTSTSSYFINISFIDVNKDLAKDAVDSIIEATLQETNHEDAFPVLTDKIRRTSFANQASYNSPNIFLYSVLGITIGLVISLAIVFSKEFLSAKFRSKEEIERELEITVIGTIPKKYIKGGKNGKK